MGDEAEETYEEVKAAVEPEEVEEAEPEPPKPKPRPKARPKPKEEEAEPEPPKPKEPRKAGKNDKVECADCGKTMSANTLRYKHVCKLPKSDEIQKEKPRRRAEKTPSPRTRKRP